jgi:cyclophilin family peptidyl-prolyl cis-trans isomerase
MFPAPAASRPAGIRRLLPALATLGLALCLSAGARAETVSSSLQPRVRIETTAGAFVIEVDTARSPLTAENFLRYVRSGFYEGLLMHRVIANFVVQGGGYTPDYRPRETAAAIVNESGNGLSNARGSVGMARGDSPHSATSQFYVNVKDNPGLNPLPSRWGYAVFGQVVEGMDVIDRMAYVATGERAGFADTPLEQIVIRRAYVVGEQDEATATEPAPQDAPAEGVPPAAPTGDAKPGETPEGAEPAGEAAGAEASAPPEGGAAASQP